MNLNEDVDIARRDLKSALEEIERKSFALHGLERENAALREQVKDYETSRAELDALAKNWYREYREQVEKNTALRAEITTVTGAMRADDERLRQAAERVGMIGDCDTPEWMADEIIALRAEIRSSPKALIEENEKLRAKLAEYENGWKACMDDNDGEQHCCGVI